jgi:hypothetical protein
MQFGPLPKPQGERWWWLPAFCVASFLFHVVLGFGVGARGKGMPVSPASPSPPPLQVEVVAAAPTPRPSALPKRVVARPVTRVAMKIPPPRHRVGAHGPQTVTNFLSVHSAGVRNAIPMRPPPNLGSPLADRRLAATPAAALPQPLPPAAIPAPGIAGHGGGGGPALPAAPSAAPDAPAPGVKDAGGSGAGAGGGAGGGVGKVVGGGSANGPGDRAGGGRGAPFGDPDGVRGGAGSGGGYAGVNGTPGAGGSGGGNGEDSAVRIVYVLDISASMDDDGKIGKVRTALHKALHDLRADDRFAILVFAEKPTALMDHLVPATPGNIAQADSDIDAIQTEEGTNVSAAIDRAFALPGVQQIYLMSDGEPNYGILDPSQLRAYVRQTNNREISISTYALGVGEQFPGVQLLHHLADDNHGSYRYVDLHRKRRGLFR